MRQSGYKTAIWRAAVSLVIGLGVFVVGSAVQAAGSKLPLRLSPVPDPEFTMALPPSLLMAFRSVNALIEDHRTDADEQVLTVDGVTYELGLRWPLPAQQGYVKSRLTYRAATYERDIKRAGTHSGLVFQTRIQLWESQWDSDLMWTLTDGLYLGWHPLLVRSHENYRSVFFREDHDFRYDRQRWSLTATGASWLLRLAFQQAVRLSSQTYLIQSPEVWGLEAGWHVGPDWFAAGRLEWRRHRVWAAEDLDTWNPQLGVEFAVRPRVRAGVYGQYQPAWHGGESRVRSSSLETYGLLFLLELEAYEDAWIDLSVEMEQATFDGSQRQLEYLTQRMTLQFDYRL
jgi:hypothetical protein